MAVKDRIVSKLATEPDHPPDGNRNFSFTSGNRELITRGLMEPIDAPAADGHEADSRFCKIVGHALDRARLAGQDNPIVVGAIPFDPKQASCLYVPEQYEWRRLPEASHAATAVQPELLSQNNVPDEHSFKQAVEKTISNFRPNNVLKAVLSVQRKLTFTRNVDLPAMRDSLVAQNPSGYFFHVPLPDGSTLIGVSPELLVSKQGPAFICNPLAGSARRLADPRADQENADWLSASEKNQYEHRLVTADIANQLDGWCNWLRVPEQPSLIRTDTLWHLSTRIEGELSDPRTTALQLACRLHPTPAVCGFPTEPARRLIRSVEPFERGLFTGMVGWCDAAGNGEWVVTIRCGTVRGNHMQLFAGAGIVEASDPASEWAEVQTKLGTMLRACGLPH